MSSRPSPLGRRAGTHTPRPMWVSKAENPSGYNNAVLWLWAPAFAGATASVVIPGRGHRPRTRNLDIVAENASQARDSGFAHCMRAPE
ncbi:hypothetical protein BRAS3843_40015 [Bradyrhizobium sp. STM 3843]|nr:hypothetical protein BRAS3843_40015 [Bradyrhizobium sp. STM 3843]